MVMTAVGFIMVMGRLIRLMGMLVAVFMGMGVRMGMAVGFALMAMRMLMLMGVFMCMIVFMSVHFYFHCCLLFPFYGITSLFGYGQCAIKIL